MNNQYILGTGSPLVDLLIQVDYSFLEQIKAEKGGATVVNEAEMNAILRAAGQPAMAPGGSACNTVFGLAGLGMPTAIFGKIGHDKEGEFFRQSLMSKGGRGDLFRYSANTPTGRCLSLVTPDSDRTMRACFGASAEIQANELQLEDLKNIRHVHMEGYQLYFPGIVERIVEVAKAAGCTISIDLSAFEVVRICNERLWKVLPCFDVVFANEFEAAELLGPGTPEELVERLGKYVPVACVMLGKKGSIVKSSTGIDKVSANLVEPVDTTGAGDLWACGFLYGYLNNYSARESAWFGSLVSSEIVQVIGAQIPDDRWASIKQKMGI